MDKNVSIVKVDSRHYRIIARENWGLTREQMKGKHVHHRIPRSKGGTNDPTNLYVCSEWFHKNVWHAEDSYSSMISYANEGGQKSYREKKGIHGRTPEKVRQDAIKAGNSGGWKKSQEREVGIFGDRSEWRDAYVNTGKEAIARFLEKDPDHQRKAGHKGAEVLQSLGKGIHAPGVAAKGGATAGKMAVESGQLAKARTRESIMKGVLAAANTKWMDPDHPELGVNIASVISRKQKALGYPNGKKNRVKVM
jgi:hypothetical protein